MFSPAYYTQEDAAILLLLKKLKVDIDPEEVLTELSRHPYYPSILALSDVLKTFKIDNEAFNVDGNNIYNLKPPFLAHINDSGRNAFVVVDKITGNDVWISGEHWQGTKIAKPAFEKMFTWVVLVTSYSPRSSLFNNIRLVLSELKAPISIIIMLVIFFLVIFFHSSYFAFFNWPIIAATIFKSAGLIVSILLLITTIDKDNPLIKKLCDGGKDSKVNCNSILSSPAATVFKGLSWSDVGFFYFAGTFLSILFCNHSLPVLQILAVFNIVGLPYTFYSIYYQAFIARQWCVLCCSIQALLWMEFFPLLTFLNVSFVSPAYTDYSIVFICMVLPIILWVWLKPALIKLRQIKQLKRHLSKFKYNAEIFNMMLEKQPRYALPNEDWCIVLGNKEAENIIVMVSNPYCSPCAETHALLHNLLQQNENLQARIIFNAQNIDGNPKTMIERHLMALNDLPDKTIIKQALYNWYHQKEKNYKVFAHKHPVVLDEGNIFKLDNQRNWCAMATVSGSPTLFVNGYKLPPFYTLDDVKYMLD